MVAYGNSVPHSKTFPSCEIEENNGPQQTFGLSNYEMQLTPFNNFMNELFDLKSSDEVLS